LIDTQIYNVPNKMPCTPNNHNHKTFQTCHKRSLRSKSYHISSNTQFTNPESRNALSPTISDRWTKIHPGFISTSEVRNRTSGKQNYALLLFPEIEESYGLDCFLGASPQTPWVGFAEFWVGSRLLIKQNYALLLFLEIEASYGLDCFLGASPQTPWVGFAEFWVRNRLPEPRFLLPFLEKEEYYDGTFREAELRGLGLAPEKPSPSDNWLIILKKDRVGSVAH
jgi:hypothetical protein